MGNITPIRAVKPIFSPVLALNAALNFEPETASKMALAIVAMLVTQTDDRAVVRVRYSELARRLRVGARCIEIHFAQLLASGLLTRPDPRVPFEYAWNVDVLHTLAHAERPAVAKNSLCITGLSWASADEQEVLSAYRNGYGRGYKKRTGREGFAPRLPSEAKCRELLEFAYAFGHEHGIWASEAARYLAYGYVTADHGAWKLSNGNAPAWELLVHSNVAEERAVLLRSKAKERKISKAKPTVTTPPPDPRASAARAAEVARAAGMAGAR